MQRRSVCQAGSNYLQQVWRRVCDGLILLRCISQIPPMVASPGGLCSMMMIFVSPGVPNGQFRKCPRGPATSATCAAEGGKFRKVAKREISDEHPELPCVSSRRPHTPRAPLQPCSELAGVFLCKRPILWDARIAMEAFEGHHTKAQRQKGRL